MAAEALADVEVSWHGLAGDRRWAFVQDGMASSGFPWLTIRDRPEMGRFRPSFVDQDRPDASPTVVITPAGERLDVTDPALAAELAAGARVIRQNRGVFDTFPLSVLSTQSVAGLGALAGAELDALRFRPNLLIDAPGDEAFPEDAWVGCVLRIGGMAMRVDQRDQRCVMVTIDPVTQAGIRPSCGRSLASAAPASASTARQFSLAASRSATWSASSTSGRRPSRRNIRPGGGHKKADH